MRIPIQIQMTAGENGPAALAMILGYFGRYVPLYELREVCVTSRNGTSPEQMMEAARHYGLEAELKTLSIGELKNAQLPLMICWKKRYYAIITRFRGDLVKGNVGADKIRIGMDDIAGIDDSRTLCLSGLRGRSVGFFQPGSLHHHGNRGDTLIVRVDLHQQ